MRINSISFTGINNSNFSSFNAPKINLAYNNSQIQKPIEQNHPTKKSNKALVFSMLAAAGIVAATIFIVKKKPFSTNKIPNNTSIDSRMEPRVNVKPKPPTIQPETKKVIESSSVEQTYSNAKNNPDDIRKIFTVFKKESDDSKLMKFIEDDYLVREGAEVTLPNLILFENVPNEDFPIFSRMLATFLNKRDSYVEYNGSLDEFFNKMNAAIRKNVYATFINIGNSSKLAEDINLSKGLYSDKLNNMLKALKNKRSVILSNNLKLAEAFNLPDENKVVSNLEFNKVDFENDKKTLLDLIKEKFKTHLGYDSDNLKNVIFEDAKREGEFQKVIDSFVENIANEDINKSMKEILSLYFKDFLYASKLKLPLVSDHTLSKNANISLEGNANWCDKIISILKRTLGLPFEKLTYDDKVDFNTNYKKFEDVIKKASMAHKEGKLPTIIEIDNLEKFMKENADLEECDKLRFLLSNRNYSSAFLIKLVDMESSTEVINTSNFRGILSQERYL